MLDDLLTVDVGERSPHGQRLRGGVRYLEMRRLGESQGGA